MKDGSLAISYKQNLLERNFDNIEKSLKKEFDNSEKTKLQSSSGSVDTITVSQEGESS